MVRIIPLCFLALCAASSAFGQEVLTVVWLQQFHKKADRNGDGKLSFDELMSHADLVRSKMMAADAQASIDELDTDKDGRLSLQEYMSNLSQEAGGNPDLLEWAKVEEQNFQAADLDNDGLLGATEAGVILFPHNIVTETEAKAAIAASDEDDDGQLGRDEFETGDEELEWPGFEIADIDGDGFVTLSEMMSWMSGRAHTISEMRTLLQTIDIDEDRHISEKELVAFREAAAKEKVSDEVSHAEQNLKTWMAHDEL
mmetsp:Transcript_16791/g.48776  ORF Transcript_16791/g.48776 Transcript_16791/m.48776 type:complete len:256 (-) Transcript_16791:91-858(-)